eukprot:9554170-Heterocapsa_arctica.AAC.1
MLSFWKVAAVQHHHRGAVPTTSQGYWWVECDDAGAAELFSDEADLYMPVEVLDKTVCIAKSDGRYIAQIKRGEDGPQVFHELSALQASCSKAQLVVSYVPCGATKTVIVNTFPHCN